MCIEQIIPQTITHIRSIPKATTRKIQYAVCHVNAPSKAATANAYKLRVQSPSSEEKVNFNSRNLIFTHVPHVPILGRSS